MAMTRFVEYMNMVVMRGMDMMYMYRSGLYCRTLISE